MLKWFNSYLSGWVGVPQGYVLGPCQFLLLYVNDILENIRTNIRLFADDTSLYTVIENEDSVKLLNEDLREIAKWADDWLII